MFRTFEGRDALQGRLTETSKRLVGGNGILLPYDQYLLAGLLRGMDTVRSFAALAKIDAFLGCCALARMQLDSVARLNAILMQTCPHDIADELLSERVELRKVKDGDGERLTDRRCIDLLAKQNPWVEDAYHLLNGSVHLSTLHKLMLAAQSVKIGDEWQIAYVEGAPFVSDRDKSAVNTWFKVTTEAFCAVETYWSSRRRLLANDLKWKRLADENVSG